MNDGPARAQSSHGETTPGLRAVVCRMSLRTTFAVGQIAPDAHRRPACTRAYPAECSSRCSRARRGLAQDRAELELLSAANRRGPVAVAARESPCPSGTTGGLRSGTAWATALRALRRAARGRQGLAENCSRFARRAARRTSTSTLTFGVGESCAH